ncbi:hypothetical protein chiPu_0022779 [Chiloscyllium punctatum]|uniref:Uncharacterized protein n=1 Tax=Chiloscyllium punctatum TaxID=137246 RepID=A0A401TA13_CHIPU|nr:hypothetical protein [Chiloscyllium punctatum]
MVSPAIALAFIPFLMTLIIRYRYYFLLFWRAVILRKIQDYTTGLSREERAFQYVMTHSIPGDPENILSTFDTWCYHSEYLSNVGPEKGKWNVVVGPAGVWDQWHIALLSPAVGHHSIKEPARAVKFTFRLPLLAP